MLAGAILVALLALAFELALAGIQRLLTPAGIQVERRSPSSAPERIGFGDRRTARQSHTTRRTPPMSTHPRLRALFALLAALALALAVAACGDDDDTTSAETRPRPRRAPT